MVSKEELGSELGGLYPARLSSREPGRLSSEDLSSEELGRSSSEDPGRLPEETERSSSGELGRSSSGEPGRLSCGEQERSSRKQLGMARDSSGIMVSSSEDSEELVLSSIHSYTKVTVSVKTEVIC